MKKTELTQIEKIDRELEQIKKRKEDTTGRLAAEALKKRNKWMAEMLTETPVYVNSHPMTHISFSEVWHKWENGKRTT